GSPTPASWPDGRCGRFRKYFANAYDCLWNSRLLGARVAAVNSDRAEFAANLRRHRKRLGLSQEGLGTICDLHRTEISLLERCKRSPRLETIRSLASGLGVSSCELMEGDACERHKSDGPRAN